MAASGAPLPSRPGIPRNRPFPTPYETPAQCVSHEAEVNVCANIEDAYLQRRPFVGVFEETRIISSVFFARVDAVARDRTPSVCFDVCDQGRELIAIAPTRENDEAFSGEFSRDQAAPM